MWGEGMSDTPEANGPQREPWRQAALHGREEPALGGEGKEDWLRQCGPLLRKGFKEGVCLGHPIPDLEVCGKEAQVRSPICHLPASSGEPGPAAPGVGA